MHAVLSVSAAHRGIVYINGRLAGEVGEKMPAVMPVGQFGPVYVQLFPFGGQTPPASARLTLSGGLPVPNSLEGDCADVIGWPDGLIEIELTAGGTAFEQYTLELDEVSVLVDRGGARFTSPIGSYLHSLPTTGGCSLKRHDRGYLLSGSSPLGNDVALLVSPDCSRTLFIAEGDSIEYLSADDAFSVISELNDLTGHIAVQRWEWTGDEYQAAESTVGFANGVPRQPSSPEETALAAAQAAILGMADEAAGYISEADRQKVTAVLDEAASYGGAVRLPRPPIDGRPAIGLLREESEGISRVFPLYYGAEADGSTGYWRLNFLRIAAG